MPTRQAKATSQTRRRLIRRRPSRPAFIAPPGAAHISYVVTGDRATHVLVPIAEFEEMQEALADRQLSARLAAPRSDFVSESDASMIVAVGELAAARTRLGLTQTQLGDRAGMRQSQIARIEKNPHRATVRTLRRLAQALEIDLGRILA